MFPISFNAFGDIATMITIVYAIAQALDDSRGSADEYRTFGELLEEIRDLHASSPEDISPRVLEGIKGCCEVLEKARQMLSRYSALEGTRGHCSLRHAVVKLRWRLLKRDEAEVLHVKLFSRMELLLGLVDRTEFADLKSGLQDISVQTSVVEAAIIALKNNIHLGINMSRSIIMRNASVLSGNMRAESAAIRAELNSLNIALNNGLARIAQNMRNRHQTVEPAEPPDRQTPVLAAAVAFSGGFALHASFRLPLFYAILLLFLHNIYMMNRRLPPSIEIPITNCILLIDILGARISLPMELCGSSKDFHETLLRLFQGRKGRSLVEMHEYELMKAVDHLPIGPKDWLRIVQPGCELEMAAIIRSPPQKRDNCLPSALLATCPRCKASMGRKVSRGRRDFALCLSCQGRISFDEAFAQASMNSLQRAHPNTTTDHGDDQNDIPFLRMIRVVYLKEPVRRTEKVYHICP
ncbi:hypothetical protein PENSPDRAFT_133812 [Peniophora sp. CONT]|nr:hypothetical protein PENSPDRAFT_133812 [Peniophora sp. CONT]